MDRQQFILAMQNVVDNHDRTSTVSVEEIIEILMEKWNAQQDRNGTFFHWDDDAFLDDGRYVSEYDWENNCLGTCVFVPTI